MGEVSTLSSTRFAGQFAGHSHDRLGLADARARLR